MNRTQQQVAGIFEEYDRLQNRLENLEDELARVQARSMGTGQSLGVERVKHSADTDRMAESMIRSESLQREITETRRELGEKYQLIMLALYTIPKEYRTIIAVNYNWDDLVPEQESSQGVFPVSESGVIDLDLEEEAEPTEAATQEEEAINAFWNAWNEPSYSPFIIALILQQLKESLKGKKNARQEIETITGMSSFRINRMIRFLKLIPELRQMVEEGRIPIRTGWDLSSLSDEMQNQIAAMMIENSDLRISKALIQSIKKG